MKEVTKEQLEKWYLEDNLSSKDIANLIGCGKTWAGKLLKKYGLTDKKGNDARKEQRLAKIAKTNLERYGSISPFGNEEIKGKTKAIFRERYGVDHPMNNKEIREKIQQTCLERYGHISPFGNKEVKAKAEQTCLERFGSTTCFGNRETQEKVMNTLRRKYHTHSPRQLHMSDKARKLFNDREAMKTYLESFDAPPPLYDLIEDLGVTHCALNKKITEFNLRELVNYFPGSSLGEREIQRLLDDWGISYRKDRTILEGLEIDVYCPNYRIGIEFNGNHWHSVDSKGRDYHRNKSIKAQEKGVFLYHIFEYEWDNNRDQIMNQLRNLFNLNENRIFARKCEIREVDSKLAKEFLEQNHLQGSDSSSVKLGLFYNNELMSLMTFGKPRFNKNYQWELLRFCCKANTSVVGGASRLFKHFVRNYNPENVLSYSNVAHTRGELYNVLGFKKINHSQPNYIWVKGREFITRYKSQKHKLIKQFPEYETLSETEIMTELGYEKLEDAGNITWLYERTN